VDTATGLIAENAALAELLREADLATPVPTCPEWTLDQLMRHVGRGDRWSAQIVAEQAGEFIDPRTVPGGKPPADRDAQMGWLRQGVRELLDAVAQSGPETPVWTFLGMRPSAWWIRRRMHETAVHRADAALALGVDFQIEPAIAADGITEYLERVMIRADAEGPAGGDRPLGDGIPVDHEHARATVALRGRSRDLLLAIVRRGTAAELGLEIFGDQAVWDTWLARTPF
jgi:uncharacterized protein (TIGR03083 family)